MINPLTIECDIQLTPRRRRTGTVIPAEGPTTAGRIPRVARLMALAIHLETLVQAGSVKDYAEIARLGHVTRARVTQIMNLLMLASDIQEEILFLPAFSQGREPLHIRQLQRIASEPHWCRQRELWRNTTSLGERTHLHADVSGNGMGQ